MLVNLKCKRTGHFWTLPFRLAVSSRLCVETGSMRLLLDVSPLSPFIAGERAELSA